MKKKAEIINVLNKTTAINNLDPRVNKNDVLNEIAKIAFTNRTGIFTTFDKNKELNQLTDDEKACIASIKNTKFGVEITFYSKEKALEALARHLGLFDKNSTLQTTDDIKGDDEHVLLSNNELC